METKFILKMLENFPEFFLIILNYLVRSTEISDSVVVLSLKNLSSFWKLTFYCLLGKLIRKSNTTDKTNL